ncbi:hypothetical protein [Arthrobacter globiformis]|uniref:hypothetical protein n=1 Tax=Arthrobacter globiformis TaxID=1665 RepID=UPI002791F1DC|nr:hypothetical protein [Arthrobacter globiformis]MDQ0620092.1 hypothetical protein [Arthrobacter globiformis]
MGNEPGTGRRGLVRMGMAAAVAAAISALAMPQKAAAADTPDTYVLANRDAADSYQIVWRRINFSDTKDAKGSVFNIDHWGTGAGNTKSPGQTYGLDIHNFPGAERALVIHQYSSVGPAVHLDNTGSKPMVEIHNTQNNVINPGSDGTGDYFLLRDHGTATLRVTKDLQFRTEGAPPSGAKGILIYNAVTKPLSVQTPANTVGLEVVKTGPAGGEVLRVDNRGTGKTASFKNATGEVSGINPNGEYENNVPGQGLILKSPNGTRFRITVADDGTLSATPATP